MQKPKSILESDRIDRARRFAMRQIRAVALFALVVAIGTSVALAHIGIYPGRSATGASQRYMIHVPTEGNVSTVRIELEVPADFVVSSVEPNEGWKEEQRKDAAGRIVGLIWSGGSIKPKTSTDFFLVGRNPSRPTQLVWKAIQIFEDGTKSEWTGERGTRTPAPVTDVQ
jgi:uncharacterized protein YcnI